VTGLLNRFKTKCADFKLPECTIRIQSTSEPDHPLPEVGEGWERRAAAREQGDTKLAGVPRGMPSPLESPTGVGTDAGLGDI